MKISVVIPTYSNFKSGLIPCIESIIKYTDNSKIDIEVVVVANGSPPEIFSFLKNCSNSGIKINTLYYNEAIGFTKASNIGIKYSLEKGSDIVILLNDDCQILESEKNNWINLLINKINDNTGIVGVHSLDWNNNEFVVFYCVAISKKVFNKIGLLDETFNPGYGEDIDFCIRAKMSGFDICNVDEEKQFLSELKLYTGQYPLYHSADKTVNNLNNWSEIKERNMNILKERYNKMKIVNSIIIPTYNHLEDCLKPCIESIIKYTDLIETELIVVSNGCVDNTDNYIRELQKEHSNIILISQKDQLGFIKAVNRGLEAMVGDYAILFNNDNILMEQNKNDWISILKRPFSDNSVGITSPITLWSYPLEFDYAVFFCSMISKSLIDKIGYLDESFGFGMCDDVDYSYRAIENGFKIIRVPSNSELGGIGTSNMISGSFPVYHVGSATFKDFDFNSLINKNIIHLVYKYSNNIKLNLGCGNDRLNGYINIDSHPSYGDIHLSVDDLSLFKDNSVSEINAIHLLEHFHRDDTLSILTEWNRILIRGGNLFLEMPNMFEHCREFCNLNNPPNFRNLLLSNIYGSLCKHSPHLTGFDPVILKEKLTQSNFENINFTDTKYHRYGGNEYLNMRCECSKKKITRDMDIDQICNDISEENRNLAIEIGCFVGDSTISFAKHFKKVIAIDAWKSNYDSTDFISQSNLENAKRIFYNRMKDYPNVEVMKMDSNEAVNLIQNNSADFIYIDANHTYDMVKKDISSWLPKVKQSGFISGHDYSEWCDVPRAVNEFFKPDKVYYDSSWIYKLNKSNKRKVYDCIMFYNELELLLIRLNELYEVVDEFIVVECTKTHSGKNKPLYYEESKHIFDRFKDKIVHMVLDWKNENCNSWNIESAQRDHVSSYLSRHANDDDLIIINDADEIVRKETILNYTSDMGIKCVDLKHHYYYLNCVNESSWPHVKIGTWKLLKNLSFSSIRYLEHFGKIENGGWHFSFCGGTSAIMNKIDAYAHTEYNNPKYNNIDNINESIKNGVDLYHRDSELPYKYIEIDESYPSYIKNNIDYFKKIGFIKDISEIKVKNIEVINNKIDVTATISTKGRYDTTLPICIQAILSQTYKPKRFILFDDNDEPKMLLSDPIYNGLFKTMHDKGITVDVIYGRKSGQVANHQLALQIVNTDWIWRLDDDNIPESNALKELINCIDNKCAAVGGLVIDPSIDYNNLPRIASNDIDKIYYGCNIQWYKHPTNEIKSVDHLYSSFLFNRNIANKIGGYCDKLSRVGHREETIFTHSMKKAGYTLYVNPKSITWHYRYKDGGIRSVNGDCNNDEMVFSQYLMSCGIVPKEMKLFVLNCGLGDTFCFKHLIPEIKEKFKGKDLIFAVCCPDAFWDIDNITLISIREAIQICGDIEKFNVYKMAFGLSNKKSLTELFRDLYKI